MRCVAAVAVAPVWLLVLPRDDCRTTRMMWIVLRHSLPRPTVANDTHTHHCLVSDTHHRCCHFVVVHTAAVAVAAPIAASTRREPVFRVKLLLLQDAVVVSVVVLVLFLVLAFAWATAVPVVALALALVVVVLP